jgi:hypothetical protein
MAKTRANPADSPPTTPAAITERLTERLRQLRLPTFRDHFQSQAERAAQENLSYPQWGILIAAKGETRLSPNSGGTVHGILSETRKLNPNKGDLNPCPILCQGQVAITLGPPYSGKTVKPGYSPTPAATTLNCSPKPLLC